MQNYRDNPLIGREKAKLYREANPEKVRAATDAWHEANREYRGGYKKAKYQQNAEANRAAGRARYEGNKDFLRESSRVRMATLKLAGRLSVDNAKRSAHTAKRRASSLQATPPWFGEFDDLVAREAQDLRLRRNKMTSCRWEVDHAYPLRSKWVSGLHCAANLQVIPKPLNNSKSNRDVYTEPLSWIQAL